MPEKIEQELKARARKLKLGKERTGAYVYGTLAKIKHEAADTPLKPKRKTPAG